MAAFKKRTLGFDETTGLMMSENMTVPSVYMGQPVPETDQTTNLILKDLLTSCYDVKKKIAFMLQFVKNPASCIYIFKSLIEQSYRFNYDLILQNISLDTKMIYEQLIDIPDKSGIKMCSWLANNGQFDKLQFVIENYSACVSGSLYDQSTQTPLIMKISEFRYSEIDDSEIRIKTIAMLLKKYGGRACMLGFQNISGNTLLMTSIQTSKELALLLLTEYKDDCNIGAVNESYRTAFSIACFADIDIVKAILTLFPVEMLHIDYTNESGNKPLNILIGQHLVKHVDVIGIMKMILQKMGAAAVCNQANSSGMTTVQLLEEKASFLSSKPDIYTEIVGIIDIMRKTFV